MRKKNANATVRLALLAGVEGWSVKVVIDTDGGVSEAIV
jgi:hypothetical protein